MLVSPNFLASKFITEVELPSLLEAASKKGVIIYWILISACLNDYTELLKIKAAHDIEHPLDTLSEAQLNQTLTNIAREIISVFNSSMEIIIIHSIQHEKFAQRLSNELKQTGYLAKTCSVLPNFENYFDIEIEQSIRRANVVIALITSNLKEENWYRYLIIFAKEINKTIIPMIIEKNIVLTTNKSKIINISNYKYWNEVFAKLYKIIQNVRVEERKEQHVPKVEKPCIKTNPFLFGSAIPAEFFIGRKSSIKSIQERVGNDLCLQSISIVSNRRMGKTSLLNYICKKSQEIFSSKYDYVPVYVDAMDFRAHSIEGIMRILRMGINKQLTRELWSEKDDGKLNILSEAFEELAEDNGIRLVLLLDEWESIMTFPELDDLLYTLRACGSQSWIGMITATAHLLSDFNTEGNLVSNFSDIFSTHYLGNMPRSEWEEIIYKGFKLTDREPSWKDYEFIEKFAGGHPHLTQLAGYLIWKAKQEHWNEKQIVDNFKQEANIIFSDIFHRLNSEQLRAFKILMGIGTDKSIPVNMNIINEFKLRGLINENNELFCKPFADFILRTMK